MREIKFRAWNGIKMDYNPCGDEYNGPTPINSLFEPEILALMKYELMQYTGLKDKNGKEIYENDIIKWPTGAVSEMKFEHTGCGCHDGYGWFISPDEAPTVEVIGNIYSNPELLK